MEPGAGRQPGERINFMERFLTTNDPDDLAACQLMRRLMASCTVWDGRIVLEAACYRLCGCKTGTSTVHELSSVGVGVLSFGYPEGK
jgi:hypothetical protein